jgi:hypothetical protein
MTKFERYNVDICITCVADKPPKLPLREELESLGVEVIYNAHGAGNKASKHEAKRALKFYREKELAKELKKRRFFPKSSKRIKEKLAERRQIEHDLGAQHAFSYEAYEHELLSYDDDKSGSSNSSSSQNTQSTSESTGVEKSRLARQRFASKQARRRWGLAKKHTSKKGVKDESQGMERSEAGTSQTLQDLVGKEVFGDWLAPANEPGRVDEQSSTASHDPSSVSSHNQDPLSLMEIQFTTSPTTKEDLPGLKTLGKSTTPGQIDIRVENAFQDFGSSYPIYARQPSSIASEGEGMTDFEEENTCSLDQSHTWPIYDQPSSSKDEDEDEEDAGALDQANSWPVYARQPSSEESESEVKVDFEEQNTDSTYQSKDWPINTPQPFSPASGGEVMLDVAEEDTDAVEESQSWAAPSNTSTAFVDPAAIKTVSSAPEAFLTKAGDQGEANSLEIIPWIKDAFATVSEEVYIAAGMENRNDIPLLKRAQDLIHRKGSGLRPPLGGKNGGKLESDVMTLQSPSSSLAREIEMLDTMDGARASASVDSLFASLKLSDTTPDDIRDIFTANPELAYVRKHDDGRTPLHTLCDRGILFRSTARATDLTDTLVNDISNYEKLIAIIVSSHKDSCLIVDRKRDLAVHLLARRLMEWEAGWYETVYEQAQNEKDDQGRTATAITTLYQIMSRCVHKVLQPMADSKDLCREPGSVGTILPLHIAAIFTASVPTLRSIVEAYPEAATLRCNLEGLRTFIPDDSLPLELHDNLSTDFPKWEVEATYDSHPEIKWSESKTAKKHKEDCMRRSDLLFAYNPNVAPYRFEKSRIRRLESRVKFEATQIVVSDSERMSRAIELIWVWMCTFRESTTNRATYINSVKRIISTLPLTLVKHLASIETIDKRFVIDAANPECSRAIQTKLDCVTEMIIPVGSHTTVSSITVKSLASQTWEEAQSIRLSLAGKSKGYAGLFCRTVFNIEVDKFPTSFIILPYRLTKDKNGKLGMASAESVTVAMKFAECLLQLTDARSILCFLDAKAKKHFNESLYPDIDEESARLKSHAKINEYRCELLKLYEKGEGYLYLIDEANGIPMVPMGSSPYPLELSEPVSIVKELLPLMLVGMILMRGQKALAVLASVLLNGSATIVAPSWIVAAKEMSAYLNSKDPSESEMSPQDTALLADLVKFLSSSSSKQRINSQPEGGASEWNAELSILKTLIEVHDRELAFGGIEAQYEGPDTVMTAKSLGTVSTGTVSTGTVLSESPPVETVQKSQSEGSSTVGFSMSHSVQDVLRLSSSNSRRLDFYQPQEETTIYSQKSDGSDIEKKIPEDSKYYLLFKGLANSSHYQGDEERDCNEDTRTVGSDSERVWNDVSARLNRGAEYWDDNELLQLKVELVDQAKRLSSLGKRVTKIRAAEVRMYAEEERLYSLLHETTACAEDVRDGGLVHLRKLALRLCDLEDRILYDEIELQHLDLGAYSLDLRIEDLKTDNKKESASQREESPMVVRLLKQRRRRAITPQRAQQATSTIKVLEPKVDWVAQQATDAIKLSELKADWVTHQATSTIKVSEPKVDGVTQQATSAIKVSEPKVDWVIYSKDTGFIEL